MILLNSRIHSKIQTFVFRMKADSKTRTICYLGFSMTVNISAMAHQYVWCLCGYHLMLSQTDEHDKNSAEIQSAPLL